MTTNERIEKLKRKDCARQAGWLKKYRPDEHAILDAAGFPCRLRLDSNQQWVNDTGPLGYSDTLILKPDYEPELEYEDCEVFLCGGTLGIDKPTFKPLYSLPGLPGFVGFFRDKASKSQTCSLEYIATKIRKGHKVYARFQKD